MKVSSFRFGWIGYILKRNLLFAFWQFLFGVLFLHSRQIAFYLFRNISFSKEDLVLDIGSGDGTFANWIAYKTNCKVVGIDRILNRIEKAKKIANFYRLSAKFVCLDLEKRKINFNGKKFDKILIIDSLEHFRNPKKIISFAENNLKKGGFLFISTPALDQNRFFLSSYQDFFSYGNDKHYHEGFRPEIICQWLDEFKFSKRVHVEQIFFSIYQFFWESSELIRKNNKKLYYLVLPLFSFFSSFDRFICSGKKGNGIIVIAQK